MKFWWDFRFDDDSPEWRAHQDAARKATKEIHDLMNKLRAVSGKQPKEFQPVSEPSIKFVRMLRDRFEAARRRPKPTREKTEAYWAHVRQQAAASARFRQNF